MYYYFKRGFIDEPLGYYVIRNDSHSHVTRTREQERERYARLLAMLEEVLSSLGIQSYEIQRYKKLSIFQKFLEGI